MNGPEIFIPIVFFICCAIVFISMIIARHRERTMLIEKGVNSEEIRALYTKEYKHDPLTSLKWGFILVLGGLAILLGSFLHVRFGTEEGIMVGLVPLFVGVGLLIFYSFAAKKMS